MKKEDFTLAKGATHVATSGNCRKFAFTLAEVLITLGVIGVVAALTLPTLIANYRKKQYVTQLKKSYTVIQNAFRTAMAEDGVDDLGDTELWHTLAGDLNDNNIENSEFVKKLGKYLNITQVQNGGDGGFNYDVKYIYDASADLGTCDGAIRLADGSMLTTVYIIKSGDAGSGGVVATKARGGKLLKIYGDFAIDVNSDKKGPNQYGRDVFWFRIGQDGMLYPSGGKDGVIHYGADLSNYKSNSSYWSSPGTNNCPDGVGESCTGRVIEEGWEMKY